jgi:glycerol-3-phosphate dehydrogenase
MVRIVDSRADAGSRDHRHRLAGNQMDLLVVGGGITGACVLLEAARRGLRAGLVEREDFGAGATANCLKIVHGGLRYLQQLDVRRVRESAAARSLWLRSAPHLVEPLPVVFPTYRGRFPTRTALAAALAADRALDPRRNRGLLPERIVPEPRVLSRAECADLAPLVDHDALTGGVLFHDALVYSPERLTLEVILAAEALGAVASNHTEFVSPITAAGQVMGARLRDRLTGDTMDVGARWIINATGAWAGGVARRLVGNRPPAAQAYSIALNLVTRYPARGPAFSLSGSRRLFVVPWRGQLMVGTAHLPYEGDADGFRVDPVHVDRFTAEVRAAAPDLRLDPADVAVVHAGLLPVTGRQERARLRLLRRHRILDHRADGLMGAASVVAVKLTTAPTVARRVLDRLGVRSADGSPGSDSRLPLPGGRFGSMEVLRADALAELGDALDGDVVEHLVRTYGARWRDVVEQRHLPGWNERVVPEAPVVRAQLVYAVRAEGARTVDDLLLRRTELGPRGLVTAAARQLAEEVLSSARPLGTRAGGHA